MISAHVIASLHESRPARELDHAACRALRVGRRHTPSWTMRVIIRALSHQTKGNAS